MEVGVKGDYIPLDGDGGVGPSLLAQSSFKVLGCRS